LGKFKLICPEVNEKVTLRVEFKAIDASKKPNETTNDETGRRQR